MKRTLVSTAALAATILVSMGAAQAQPQRERREQPFAVERYQQYQQQRSRAPELYTAPAGSRGSIGATTPNQYGNFGGPGTGGGNGSP